jgi:hypothetical protein
MAVFRTHGTGTSAINLSHVVPVGRTYEVCSVTVRLSSAPTTAGTLAVTLDSGLGSNYDATLYSVDPSVGATTSIVWVPTSPMYLDAGDAVDVTYANTDMRTYGVVITVRSV